MLEFDGNCQNGQSSELNRFSTSFICSVFDGTVAESKSTDQLSPLYQLPSCSWAKSSTNIVRTHSAPHIKIQTDPSKPLPRISFL